MHNSSALMMLDEKRIFNSLFSRFKTKYSTIRSACEDFLYIVPPGSVLEKFNEHKNAVSKFLVMPPDNLAEYVVLYALFTIVAEEHDIEISACLGNILNDFFGVDMIIPLYQGKYKMPEIYFWNLDDSSDSTNCYKAAKKLSPGIKIIRMGEGIAPEDIIVSKNGNDLILKIAKSGERRIIVDWFKGPDYQIEKIVFNDGNIWHGNSIVSKCTHSVLKKFISIIPPDSVSAEFEEHKAAVASKYLTMPVDSIEKSAIPYVIFTALAEQRHVYISNDDGDLIDEFFGRRMTTPLYRGKYKLPITYYWNYGDGANIINCNKYENIMGETINTIEIAKGVDSVNIIALLCDSDLVLSINENDSTEWLIIKNWFKGPDYQVEKIAFADGNTWYRNSEKPIEDYIEENGRFWGDDICKRSDGVFSSYNPNTLFDVFNRDENKEFNKL